MVLAVDEIAHELSMLHRRQMMIREEARPHLAAWVRAEVEKCRQADGTITRETVVRSEPMERELFHVLRKAFDMDGNRLAQEANKVLIALPKIPNLLRVHSGLDFFGLIYKY